MGSRGEAHSKDAVPRRQPRGCVSLPSKNKKLGWNEFYIAIRGFFNNKMGKKAITKRDISYGKKLNPMNRQIKLV